MKRPLDSSERRAESVLAVNDREQSRYVVSRMLRNNGYTVTEAASGAEALERARSDQPDLIVLDIKLPDIDGMEVCRRLKSDAETAQSLVLHTSATFVGSEIRVRGVDVGGDGFLAEPFTSQELLATVKALLRLKRVEEFQRRRAEELAEADRRKDDFLAMLGHELRNPLNVIAVAAAVTDRFPSRDPVEARARSVVRKQTELLTRLVNDLLDVSRVTRGKIVLDQRPLDLADLLRGVISIAAEASVAPRGQVLTASLPDYPVPVLGDHVRLEQVFSNLLDNAVKYTPDGGAIHVQLDVAGGERGPEAAITIGDSGRGIPAEQLAQVFKLFYQGQTSEARVGTGLGIGLTVVKSIVELHGGSVAVRSEGHDRGSEFEIRLPALADAVDAARTDTRPSISSRRQLARNTQTVLIVEDNPDAREMLSALCRDWGYRVEVAEDGVTGIERALELRPSCAIVDIGLPGVDGYEVAKRIRASLPPRDVTLVALTGYSLPSQRQRALRSGFDLHMVKPVDSELLAAVLDRPTETIASLMAGEYPVTPGVTTNDSSPQS